MRNYAQQALDQHQLTAMVHLMFLCRHDHIEAGALRWGASLRHGDNLTEEILRKAGYEIRPFPAFIAQQGDHLSFGAWLGLLGLHLLHQRGEVESFKSRSLLYSVNLILER